MISLKYCQEGCKFIDECVRKGVNPVFKTSSRVDYIKMMKYLTQCVNIIIHEQQTQKVIEATSSLSGLINDYLIFLKKSFELSDPYDGEFVKLHFCLMGAISLYTWIHMDNIPHKIIDLLSKTIIILNKLYCEYDTCSIHIVPDLQQICDHYKYAPDGSSTFNGRFKNLNYIMIHCMLRYWEGSNITKGCYEDIFNYLYSLYNEQQLLCCDEHRNNKPESIDWTPITCFV